MPSGCVFNIYASIIKKKKIYPSALIYIFSRYRQSHLHAKEYCLQFTITSLLIPKKKKKKPTS